jgi:hypothetical protein
MTPVPPSKSLVQPSVRQPRRAYETAICARLNEAEIIPFREVSIGEWRPKVAACHENVDAWVQSNPQSFAVRGWVVYISYGGDAVGLTAHSIVKGPDGDLFDITPLCNEGGRHPLHFVAHVGDDRSFFEMKEGTGISFTCPPDLLDNMQLN